MKYRNPNALLTEPIPLGLLYFIPDPIPQKQMKRAAECAIKQNDSSE